MSKILITADDLLWTDIFRETFASRGFEVFVAFDEKDTIDIMQKEKVDLLMISEDADGFELAQKIRKNYADMKIFIFGTGSFFDIAEYRKKAVEAGANDFINVSCAMPGRVFDIVTGKISVDENQIDKVYTNTEANDSGINGFFIVKHPYLIIENQREFLFEGVTASATNDESVLMGYITPNHSSSVFLFDAKIGEKSGLDVLNRLLQDNLINLDSVIILLEDNDQKSREKAEKLGVKNFIVRSEVTYGQIAKQIKAICNKAKFNSSAK